MSLAEMHAVNVSQVNARLRAAGECVMHNAGEAPPARYVIGLSNANELPLCADCCAWWRADAAARTDDAAIQPQWITDLLEDPAGCAYLPAD